MCDFVTDCDTGLPSEEGQSSNCNSNASVSQASVSTRRLLERTIGVLDSVNLPSLFGDI
jgi:hypothetical protein